MHTSKIAYEKGCFGYIRLKNELRHVRLSSYDHQPCALVAGPMSPFPVKFSSFKFTGPQGELRRNKDGGDVDYLMLETV